MTDAYGYYCIGFPKEVKPNAMYIPKRSQKIKNKRLRAEKETKKEEAVMSDGSI